MEERLLGRESRPLNKDPLAIAAAVILVLVFGWLLFSFRFTGIYVVGSSMEPSLTGAPDNNSGLPGGDYLYADRMDMPDYSDIVVVVKPDSNEYIIKRVIALGGDAVYIDHGTVFVSYGNDGEFCALKEDYVLKENNDPFNKMNTYRSRSDPFVVPDGEMFVLGDNRGNEHAYSLDSRTYGSFSYDSMIGVVPQWSISCKSFFTAFYTFFRFGI